MTRQRPDETVLNDGPFLRAAIRLMLAGLGVMVAALFILYFAPISVAPLLSLGLYVGPATLEVRHGVLSPLTALMVVFYAILAAGRALFDDIGWSAFAAPAVYLMLATLVFGMLAMGRPFTMVYSKGAGLWPLHWAMSIMWGSLHLTSAIAAFTLMPSLAFLFVPMALMVTGAVGTLVMNFVTLGPRHARQHEFSLGSFRFAEVRSKEQHDLFYATIAEAYRSDLQRAAGPKRKIDMAEIEAGHRASDAKRDGRAMPFLVFDGEQAVGGICMFLDHPKLGLPIEHEAQISAGPWRAGGPVVEIGRLGIFPRYRLERSVLTGLFKCVIEAALERRVHTVLNDSFVWQVKLYSKIGFVPVSDRPYVCGTDSTGYGLQAQPLALDLVRMVRLEEVNTTSSEVRDIMQQYVIERFFKILAVQEMVQIACLRVVSLFRRPLKAEAQHVAE